MNKCEQYCRSIKRLCSSQSLLPSEYQQVEYLENTGEEYITTTVKPYKTVKTELKFSLSQSPSYTQMIMFGVRGTGGSVWSTCYWARLGSATQLRVGNAADYSNINITLLSGDNTLSFSSGEIKLNGSVVSTITTGFDSSTGNKCIELWSLPTYGNNNFRSRTIASAGLRIHEATFTDNGELVAHLYPCYRKSDNEPGMYDIVTETFFTNAGTGEFIVGNNV